MRPEESITKKQQAVEEFLKSFRISLNYVFLYSTGHRSFINSIQDLKRKLYLVFDYLNPFEIGFTPDALMIDNDLYKKKQIYADLVKAFHMRKIKSVQFRIGVTERELMILMEKISLPVKEILKAGGLRNILGKEEITGLFVEDLDYSLLLRDAGDEAKDIWSYLLKDAVERHNQGRIDEFVDNFDSVMNKIKSKDIVEDQMLHDNIGKFLSYLRGREEEKFRRCGKAIVRVVLRDKAIVKPEDLEKIKTLTYGLTDEEMTTTLWEVITTDDNFDSTSFELFSKLTGREDHEVIAKNFANRLERSRSSINPSVVKRIKELFFSTKNPDIKDIYLKAMSSLKLESIIDATLTFDRAALENNYNIIMLNLLGIEKTAHRINFILERMLHNWDSIKSMKDSQYLSSLWLILKEKKTENFPSDPLDKLISHFSRNFEDMALEGSVPASMAYILDYVENSSYDPQFYLDRIFKENKSNPFMLRLFFRIFTDAEQIFFDRLEKDLSNIELIANLIEHIKDSSSVNTLGILKRIFSVTNDILRIEVLKAMAGLTYFDRDFIFGIIKDGSFFMKREVIATVIKEEDDKQRSAEIMFPDINPFRRNKALLMENLDIAGELQLKAARKHIEGMAAMPFFWNSRIRKKAKEILERWDA